MTIFTLFLAIALFLGLIILSVKIVPPGNAGIRERSGRYYSTESPGLVLLIPFIEAIKFVDLRELELFETFQPITTKDQINLEIQLHLFYQVQDPFKAYYETTNLYKAVKSTAFQVIRNLISSTNYDYILDSTHKNKSIIQEELNLKLRKYGTKTNKVVIKNIKRQ